MEDINNTTIPEKPIQPTETPITPEPTPTPSNSNLFKYLFIISIFVLFIAIITFVLILNNKNPKQSPVEKNTNDISEVAPTAIPTYSTQSLEPIDGVYKVGSRTLVVKYDSTTEYTSLFFRENNQDILINKWGSYVDGDNIFRNIPSEFLLSPDGNYLSYMVGSEFEGAISEFYNFIDKKITDLKIVSEDSGFTKDNKYFYTCAVDGLIDGGIFIYQLPTMNVIYQDIGGMDLICQYDQQKNTLNITHTGYEIERIPSKTTYSFDLNKVLNQ